MANQIDFPMDFLNSGNLESGQEFESKSVARLLHIVASLMIKQIQRI